MKRKNKYRDERLSIEKQYSQPGKVVVLHGLESLEAEQPNLVESSVKNLSAKMHLSDSDRAMLEEFCAGVRRECCYETHSPKDPCK